MAEIRKATAKVAEPQPALAPAGASGDAAVHQILAEMAIHGSNGDTEKVAELTARLAELGYRI